ncbi:hypothetical protein DVR12_17805 [Chitinophaga silvatica]|uniref:Uncharacterized protein n=1 Tax=Chitinophaga silvatica TaxID=2282649 RepID=A0A3E1Y7Z3_9BACT|nr:hypothetical protein [Chitinophaga silvatica]RFS21189.1 hypothetical protein DVR12_17805 [Chitinophaga silvatica]
MKDRVNAFLILSLLLCYCISCVEVAQDKNVAKSSPDNIWDTIDHKSELNMNQLIRIGAYNSYISNGGRVYGDSYYNLNDSVRVIVLSYTDRMSCSGKYLVTVNSNTVQSISSQDLSIDCGADTSNGFFKRTYKVISDSTFEIIEYAVGRMIDGTRHEKSRTTKFLIQPNGEIVDSQKVNTQLKTVVVKYKDPKSGCQCEITRFNLDSGIYMKQLTGEYRINKEDADLKCFALDLWVYNHKLSLDSVYYSNVQNKDLLYIGGFIEGNYVKKENIVKLKLSFINEALNSSRPSDHTFTIEYNLVTHKFGKVELDFDDEDFDLF